MYFKELSEPWQRVFELAWDSVCAGSRAIGAVIADGCFRDKSPADYSAAEVFDELVQRIEVQHGL